MNRPTKSRPLTENESMNLSLTDLYMRLQAYEDTELEPEEVERFAKAVKEGRLVVLPRGDDVTPIKCTGLKCPMQAGKVDSATCKAADTCKMNIEELTDLIDDVWNRYCPLCCLSMRCMKVDGGCRGAIQDYLKDRLEEVTDNG